MSVCIYIYIYIYVCMYVYICICIYFCIYTYKIMQPYYFFHSFFIFVLLIQTLKTKTGPSIFQICEDSCRVIFRSVWCHTSTHTSSVWCRSRGHSCSAGYSVSASRERLRKRPVRTSHHRSPNLSRRRGRQHSRTQLLKRRQHGRKDVAQTVRRVQALIKSMCIVK